MRNQHRPVHVFCLATALLALLCAVPAAAGKPGRVQGQTVYVPAYSHIYHGVKTREFLLTVTLSIRNTDPAVPIRIVSVELFDESGKALRSYPGTQKTLAPFAVTEAVLEERDPSGGSGGAFLVRWESKQPALPPVVQCVMIGSSNSQGISFLTEGRVVEER